MVLQSEVLKDGTSFMEEGEFIYCYNDPVQFCARNGVKTLHLQVIVHDGSNYNNKPFHLHTIVKGNSGDQWVVLADVESTTTSELEVAIAQYTPPISQFHVGFKSNCYDIDAVIVTQCY